MLKLVLGVWRIAHNPAKVGDQVRLLAGTLVIDAGAGRSGTCLQSRSKWVRFPPASLEADCRFGLNPAGKIPLFDAPHQGGQARGDRAAVLEMSFVPVK